MLTDLMRKHGAEIAALLGALIGLSFIERLTIVTAIVAMLCGLSFGIIGAPIAAHYVDPPVAIRDYVVAGCALLLGIVGFLAAGAVHSTARNLRDWAPEFVRKLISRKTEG